MANKNRKSSDVKVSFLIVCYNQIAYIKEAVFSALQQDWSDLEIIVADDCSNDGTYDLLCTLVEEYAGPHRLSICRTKQNSGLAENFNNGLRLCSGELIVVQGGDDVSESSRVSALVDLWVANNCKPDMLYSNITRMDSTGKYIKIDDAEPEIPSLEEIMRGKFFIAGGMAAAYTRRLFDKFGPLIPGTKTEDYVLTFRALLSGGIAFEKAPLVRYRLHDKSEIHLRRYCKDRRFMILNMKSALAESKDRLRSWWLSGHKNLPFTFKLVRRHLGVRIGVTGYEKSFIIRLPLALAAILLGMPRLSLNLIRDTSFIR